MTTKTMAIAIGILIALCAGIFFYAEWEKARFDASLPEPPVPPKAQTASGGHWHGDEWHAEPHTVEQTTQARAPAETEAEPLTPHIAAPELPPDAVDLSKLSPEEFKQAIEQLYAQAGVEPPPEGYGYLWEAPFVVKRDENGKPMQYKIGEPIITIFYSQGFAPTYEQYQQYKQLQAEANLAELEGDFETAQQLHNEIQQIRDNAQGEVPRVHSRLVVPANMDFEAAEYNEERQIEKALDEAYAEMGLGYLRER